MAAVDGTPETQDLFEEAQRRRRRRRLWSGLAVAVLGLGLLGWWSATGSGQGRPPGVPNLPPGFSLAPAIPPGATPLQNRPVNGLIFRLFATPSGFPLAKVEAEWELVNARGAVEGSGSGTVGPAFSTGTGVVNSGGGWSGGVGGLQAVRNFQVTLPSITSVRVVDGAKVLDSMSPVTFDGVRFAVLAVLDVPSFRPLLVQGLDASGAIVSSSAFQLPDHPLGTPDRRTGGGSFRTNN
jgi:hypothetical protein